MYLLHLDHPTQDVPEHKFKFTSSGKNSLCNTFNSFTGINFDRLLPKKNTALHILHVLLHLLLHLVVVNLLLLSICKEEC